MEAARRREIDVVLVWRLDRWGRSVTDLLATLQEPSWGRVRFLDRGAGPDYARRSSDGRPASHFRGLRKRNSAGTNSGWFGERTTEGVNGSAGR